MFTLRFLIASLIVHLLFWQLGFYLSLNAPKIVAHQPIEIEVLDKDRELEKIRQQRVRQAQLPPNLVKPLDDKFKPKFLSEYDQRVEKEMKAQMVGMTQNRSQGQGRDQKNNQEQRQKQMAELDPDGIGAKKNLKPTQNSGGASTVGEHLPDIPDGPVTSLNTERYLFYTFFARIEERIRPLWERNVRESLQRVSMSDARKLSRGHQYYTVIEVLIDPSGRYIETLILRSSGSEAFDRDAVRSFEEAAHFPNPPREMVKSDGKIHLKFGLVVQTNG